MPMLHFLSVGQPAAKDSNKVENLVVAGLGEGAHITNPDHAVQTVIDETQKLELHPHPELTKHVTADFPSPVTSVSTTWNNVEKKTLALEHVHIPLFGVE